MPTGSKLSWTTAAGAAETSKHTRLDLWRKDFCLGGLQLLHCAPLSLRVVPSFRSSTSGMAAQSRAVWARFRSARGAAPRARRAAAGLR